MSVVLPALYNRHYSSRTIWLRQRVLVITIAPYLQHITMPLFIHRFLSVKSQKTLTILHLLFEPLPSCGIFFALSSSCSLKCTLTELEEHLCRCSLSLFYNGERLIHHKSQRSHLGESMGIAPGSHFPPNVLW